MRSPDHAWEWLYAVTGLGMRAFVAGRFDLEVVGSFPRVQTGDLWIAAHRAETDVPLLAGLMYTRGGMWRRDGARVHFAARDDLFAPGVVAAGLPLPRPLARATWSLSPGPFLPRVRAHPVRRPTGAKLGQLLGEVDPATRLDTMLGDRLLAAIRARALAIGVPIPTVAAQLAGGDFARVLWHDVTPDDLVGPGGDAAWRRHVGKSAMDLRRIVSVLRDGGPLLIFPEGRVSPDGRFGPLGEILRVIVDHGRPVRIVPVGIAYDPLRRRRTTVAVSVGASIDPAGEHLVERCTDALRRAVPITGGQIVARWLTSPAGPGAQAPLRDMVDATVARAVHEGRPVPPILADPSGRARCIASALADLRARSVLRAGAPTAPDRDRALRDPRIVRLANEDAAVWGTASPSP